MRARELLFSSIYLYYILSSNNCVMKMYQNHSRTICVVILLCSTFFGCTKVDQTERLNNSILSNNNSKYYYYYQKGKHGIVLNTEYINIVSKKKLQSKYQNLVVVSSSTNERKGSVASSGNGGVEIDNKFHTGKLKLDKKLNEEEYLKIAKSFYEDPNTEYVSPSFEDPQMPGGLLNLTRFFYVKLYNANDVSYLNYLANQYGALIIEQYEFDPLWYTLSSTSISQNSLDLANIFYETGVFECAHPDFTMEDALQACPMDVRFNEQWGSNNTGQLGGTPGVDIKACSALDIVRPSGAIIDVAVIDDGFDLTHPDIVPNPYGTALSYDCNTRTSPATLVNRYGHGTLVASIVGARENGVGIVGVAPYCRLMLVSHDFSGARGETQNLRDMAAGIDWSVQNGAEVINISWKCPYNDFIFQAIKRATIYGRGGKGCIVVCGTGNYDYDVLFPANASLNILSVGGINKCGLRMKHNNCGQEHYGSSGYGVWLEVMAPGREILAADIVGPDGFSTGDYAVVEGTSLAAPSVSGVAALILSQNPSLTVTQVRDIIESTAQKVGGYSYGYEPYRYNGSWHPEMGYGLVNAYAAVLNTPRPVGVVPGYELHYGQVVNGN